MAVVTILVVIAVCSPVAAFPTEKDNNETEEPPTQGSGSTEHSGVHKFVKWWNELDELLKIKIIVGVSVALALVIAISVCLIYSCCLRAKKAARKKDIEAQLPTDLPESPKEDLPERPKEGSFSQLPPPVKSRRVEGRRDREEGEQKPSKAVGGKTVEEKDKRTILMRSEDPVIGEEALAHQKVLNKRLKERRKKPKAGKKTPKKPIPHKKIKK